MTENQQEKKEYLELPKPEGRIFAVGDVHGCKNELVSILDYLVEEQDLSDDDYLVFVGDYIDRGPDSKGVVSHLIEHKKKFSNTFFLRGNHEDMMLDYLGFEGASGEFYLVNGGDGCLESYGFRGDEPPEMVASEFPKDHLDFYLSLERYIVIEDYVIVHAGLNPLRELSNQVNEDLFWIRDDFINNPHFFEKTIIFGHTPYENVVVDVPYKIAIDTGLVYGNTLSVVELTKGEVFQIDSGDDQVHKNVLGAEYQEHVRITKENIEKEEANG